MRHVWLFLILPLAVPSSESDAKNASRALRRIQGKHNGNVSDEQVASSGTEPSPRLSDEGGRTLSRAHHRRLDRLRRAGPADATTTVTPAAPSPGCCWSFNADTKRYQFYPRPANQACVAPYKAAPCSGAPAAAPSPAAAAAAVASSPPPPPPPPPAQVDAASPGCCWSFNADTKRYQFYPRPANQACVAPYKAAPCSGAPAAAPSPAAAAAAIVGALRSSPPPPPPVVESTHQHQGHTKHQLPPPPPPPPPVVTATAAATSKPTSAVPSAAPAKTAPGTAPATKPASGGGGGSGFLTNLMLLGLCVGAYVFRAPLLAALGAYFSTDKEGKGGASGGASGDKYKRVGSGSDEDTLSQTSTCGQTAEEIDPVAEEWAERLAAQREGREYVPKTPMTACSGCGAGAVPKFGSAAGAASGVAPGAQAEEVRRAFCVRLMTTDDD
jgi:hypothetical protein